MKARARYFGISLLLLVAGVSVPGFAQDLQEKLRALQTASIADSHLYLPQQTVDGCPDNRVNRDPSQPIAEKLLAAAAQARDYSNVHNGRALLIMLDGKIIHESYEGGTDETTRFVSFSLHKSLVGMAIHAAIDDGIIPSYTARLGALVPALADDPKKDISLSNLMSMEGGLKLYSMSAAGKEAMALTFGSDIDAATLKLPVDAEPEATFSYNSSSAQLAGIALANALRSYSGESYSAYLHRRIWCPVGNAEASLWLDSENGSPRYFAGLHATLRDWAEIGEAFRSGLPDGTSFTALEHPSTTNPNYGRLVWLGAPENGQRRFSEENPLVIPHSAPYKTSDMVFFDGFGGQRVYISKSTGLVIARFGDISLRFDDAIIPNLILGALE